MKDKKRWVFLMVMVLALTLIVLSSLSFAREVVAQVYPLQPTPSTSYRGATYATRPDFSLGSGPLGVEWV